MIWIAVYLSITLLFAFSLIITEGIVSLNDKALTSFNNSLAFSVLVLLWPLTILLMMYLYLIELRMTYYKNKVINMLKKYESDSFDECANKLNLSQLNLIKFSYDIGAINLSEKSLKIVQQYLEQKTFEKHLLGDKDV